MIHKIQLTLMLVALIISSCIPFTQTASTSNSDSVATATSPDPIDCTPPFEKLKPAMNNQFDAYDTSWNKIGFVRLNSNGSLDVSQTAFGKKEEHFSDPEGLNYVNFNTVGYADGHTEELKYLIFICGGVLYIIPEYPVTPTPIPTKQIPIPNDNIG